MTKRQSADGRPGVTVCPRSSSGCQLINCSGLNKDNAFFFKFIRPSMELGWLRFKYHIS